MALVPNVVLVGTLSKGELCVYSLVDPWPSVMQAVEDLERTNPLSYSPAKWMRSLEVVQTHARERGRIELLQKHRTKRVIWFISDFDKRCTCCACECASIPRLDSKWSWESSSCGGLCRRCPYSCAAPYDTCLCAECVYGKECEAETVLVGTVDEGKLCLYMFDGDMSDEAMEAAEELADFSGTPERWEALGRVFFMQAWQRAYGGTALHVLKKLRTSRVVWFQ